MAITTRPPTCEGCLLHETPGCSGFMPAPEGKNLIPLLIVGEALGESEAKDSLPFRPYAESGSLLERALRSVGIQREQISITNLIHCRPPNNRFAGEYYEDPAAQHCRQYLDVEVARLKPRAILALGSIPFKYLSGFSMRGKQAQDYTRGYPVESVWYPGIPVIGTYHPAFLRRGATELFPVVVHDLHKALQIARGRVQWDRIPERTYQVGGVPELQQLYAIFSAHPDRLIAFDIETRESSNEDEDKYDGLSRDAQILTVQFAHSPRTGLSVPWDEQTIPWIQAILALPNPRSGHNCFHRNTSVWMADGSWKNIAEIKIGDEVRTADDAGNYLTEPVTGVLHTKDDRPWVEVKVDGAYERGTGRWGSPGVVCTPDHEWILRDGTKIMAAHLQKGMEILIPRRGSFDLIFGSLLGDGSVRADQNQFRCSHTNHEYALEKAKSFGYATKLKQRAYRGGYKESTIAWELTAAVPHYWRELFYESGGSRIWQPPVSDAALAIWYCDDGTISKDGAAKIAIHRYSTYRNAILVWARQEFGMASLQTNDDNLYIFKAASRKFFERISPFVPPSMYYKLPVEYQGYYNDWMAAPQLQVGVVIEVKSYTSKPNLDKHKYCLEVGERHRFFTRAGLVSNCWLFDEPVLTHQGIKLPQLSRDTMAMWHHLQPDLPANLAFVASFYGIERPWKHEMGEDLGIYGCTDVDAVQRIESRIESDLRALRYKDPRTGETGITLWDGFEQYVQPLRPILKRMEERGIPRDPAATQELITYIDTEKARLWELIQAACPSDIRPVKRWVEWPEDLRPAVKAYAEANPIVPISPKTGKPLKERVPVIKIGDGLNIDELVIAAGELGYKFGLVPNLNKDCVYKLQDFLPNSTDHLKNYLRYFAVKVPVNLSDEETTGRTELDKLMKRLKLISEADGVSKIPTAIWQSAFAVKANKDTFPKLKQAAQEVHAFLENILTYRKLHKAKATYITGEGWTPNSTTGRIHTTFTLSATATLQLSSRKPNVQNIPKGKNPKDKVGMMLGRLLRKTVKAKPGHLIVEFDYGGCHLVTMGLEAEDPQYIRLARIDGHSFLAAHMARVELGDKIPPELADLDDWLSYDDATLAAKLAWVKKNFKGLRNDKAKPALLGNQLGLGSRKLYALNDDSFKNEAEAKQVQAILAKLFPKIGAYQARTRALAQRQGYLISPYGSIRRFFEVERFDPKTRGLVPGLDAEKAGAFFVQVNAQGKLREAMIELEEQGWNERCNLINQVHDSLVYEMPIELLEEAVPAIAAIMEKPASRLKHPTICPEGLVLQCEASIGVDWSSIEEVKIKDGKVVEWPEAIRGLMNNDAQ